MGVARIIILIGFMSCLFAQAEVKMQAIQYKKTVLIQWQYASGPEIPSAAILQRRCGADGKWKSLHKETISLSLEAEKQLGYLSAKRRKEARNAFQAALQKGNLSRPLSGDSLRMILASPDGPLVSSMLFTPDPGLAQYAGTGFLDDQPGRNCEYGLFSAGDPAALTTARAFAIRLKLSPGGMKPSGLENQAEVHWGIRPGETTPIASVRFNAYLADDKAQRAPLFESVQCLSGRDTCSWNVDLSSFSNRKKVRIRVEAVYPGLGVLDQVVFNAHVPLTQEVWRSLQPVVRVSQKAVANLDWAATHHFSRDIPIDSTVISIYQDVDSAVFHQAYKGLRTEGVVPVSAELSGEEFTDDGTQWRFAATFHSPLGSWNAFETVSVQPSYERMQQHLDWEPELSWDRAQPGLLRVPVHGLKPSPGKGERFLIINRTHRFFYDARKMRYTPDTLVVPAPQPMIYPSMQLCEQVGIQRYCSYADYPEKP